MEYRVLGPLEVVENDRAVALGGPRHRRLLSVLLLFADEIVSTDRLVDALWNDRVPNNASAILHVRMSELRSTLRRKSTETRRIVTIGSGYQLQIGTDVFDVRQFDALIQVARGARSDHGVANTAYGDAAQLWRGRPYADIADLPVAL